MSRRTALTDPVALPGRLVEIDGLTTHVLVEGSGPPVLLLAALGSNWFDLDQLADELVDRFTVIRYDRPGYGASESLPRDRFPTLRGEIDRMAAVLDAAEVTDPVLIAAHSLSSLYAEAFARDRPERTAAVMMIDGTFVMVPWRILPTALRVRNCHRAVRVVDALRLPQLMGPAVHDSVLPTPPGGFTAVQQFWTRAVCTTTTMLRATLVENAAFPSVNADLIELRRRRPAVDAAVTVVAALAEAGGWRRFWRWRQERYADMLGGVFEEISPANHFVVTQHPAAMGLMITRLARRAGLLDADA
ncbi:alpha/beta hydrolase [Williamsia sp.]|uniref:alpha/beta fold hydrolase n=1 Tax=Williamsia sp. TaxID=1872085 RepID=UPI001A3381A5|nr:alpha/beta hydrolase [Williamsia sp.]MBJ7288519.1 alpha/beta hydrolase [Williamsia sp.]